MEESTYPILAFGLTGLQMTKIVLTVGAVGLFWLMYKHSKL